MGARHIGDGDGIAALRLAPHFVVLITNPRLADGRFARMAIYDAADQLPEVPFFILDEDSEECQRWLASLDLPIITVGRAPGTGSLLWLWKGRIVEFSSRDQRLNGWQIVSKTRALFYLDSDILQEDVPG
jgi:hypothetical protein